MVEKGRVLAGGVSTGREGKKVHYITVLCSFGAFGGV